MAERSTKRRKTSPLRDADTEARRTPSRASFLSPTKASLSRFNPNLLPPTGSARRASSQGAEASKRALRSRSLPKIAFGEQSPDGKANLPAAQGNDADANVDAPPKPALLELPQPQSTPISDAVLPSIEPASVRRVVGDDEGALPPLQVGADGQPLHDLPRRGAVQTTPSKKPRRSKILAEQIIQSSPSKVITSVGDAIRIPTKEQVPSNLDGAAEQLTHREKKNVSAEQESRAPANNTVAPPQTESQDLTKLEEEKRLLVGELEGVQGEIKQYRSQLEICAQYTDGHDDDVRSSESLAELLDVLENPEERSKPKPPPVSQLLNAFLPFVNLIPSAPVEEEQVDEKPIPSHAPVELGDPTPYLELFSPFSTKSEIRISPNSPKNLDTSGHSLVNEITLVSNDGHFESKVDLTIDTVKSAITSIAISRLPFWSEHEAGPWFRQKAAGGDASALFWGLGSYFDMSVRRAKCWARCARDFEPLLRHLALEEEEAAPAAKKKGAQPKKKARGKRAMSFDGDSSQDEGEVSGIGVGLGAGDKRPVGRDEVAGFLGRDSLVFRNEDVSLQISWAIAFDWTGEAQSRIRAEAALPESWHQADERGTFKKISQTFDSLIYEKGVYDSIHVMLKLLSLKA